MSARKKFVRLAISRDIIKKRTSELARDMLEEASDSPDIAAALMCGLQTLLMASRLKIVK